jgi:hypothetical protein
MKAPISFYSLPPPNLIAPKTMDLAFPPHSLTLVRSIVSPFSQDHVYLVGC